MASVSGSCLCGEVAWSVGGDLQFMSHCHCSRCRKAHGTPFATYVLVPVESFRLLRGREHVVSYPSSSNFARPFCRRCGSVVPDGVPTDGLTGVPAGPFDTDPVVRPQAHIFVASKAPWFELADDELPRFAAYPAGIEMAVLPDRPLAPPTPGTLRGSCLCGQMTFVVTGEPLWFRNCHCSRCRKARAAAHATNLVTTADGVRFITGADALVTYKLPSARFFTQMFCASCGSPMPLIDRARNYGVVPAGSLDDDPGTRPSHHIFVASKAPWFEIADDLPQHPEFPPASR